MKTMLVSPIPRWFLLISKLLAGVFVSILQVYAFLIIASLWDIIPPVSGYFTILPALIVSGLMLGSLGMFLSSAIKQLENFAGVMNFVIFPMFLHHQLYIRFGRLKKLVVVILCLFLQSIYLCSRVNKIFSLFTD